MLRIVVLSLLVALAVTGSAWATPTVTLMLQSSKAGQAVSPGTTIDWTIKAADSTGDNLGLALVCCDLVQNPTNPALFDIPAANVASIDATMADFSRPRGIANPGEGGASTGYIGAQRGTAGQKNLVQIGGAQNTFGAAGPAGIGSDFNVNGGVGQGGSPQTIVSGSFPAPATLGTYTFHLENAKATVLTAVNTPPAFSPVVAATANATGATFSFTVGGLAGDMNCDGLVNGQDIDGFVLALFDPAGYAAQYPACNLLNGDMNSDGIVNGQDIDGFVSVLFGG